jgi:hypothetical protein
MHMPVVTTTGRNAGSMCFRTPPLITASGR